MKIPLTKHGIIVLVIVPSSVLLVFLICNLFRCDSKPEQNNGPAKKILAITHKITQTKKTQRTPLKSFPPDTNWPRGRETASSGKIDLSTFNPKNDIVRFKDDSVWWESDHDKNDTEDDHMIYKSMVPCLRLLIDIVNMKGGNLKVQDAYRPIGTHIQGSLHKEGRAIDLTCDELGLEELAKLCWIAGFDWVLHEHKARLGSHVHCSVKR